MLANKGHPCVKLKCSHCFRNHCGRKRIGWPFIAPDCEDFVSKNRHIQSDLIEANSRNQEIENS